MKQEKNLTEAEIMKALEWHFDEDKNCEDCPYVDRDEYCHILLGRDLKSILDLINSIQAEKQEITEKFNCQQTVYADLSKIIKEQADKLKTAKAEAIKEFAEKVQAEFEHECVRSRIWQIAKEMGVEL